MGEPTAGIARQLDAAAADGTLLRAGLVYRLPAQVKSPA
jgi:hypothetical protein